MQPFSIKCPTCQARLNVRHPSAIGRILSCPKCESMVEVQPPPDWTFDPTNSVQSDPDQTHPVSDNRDADETAAHQSPSDVVTTNETAPDDQLPADDDPTQFDWAAAPERRRRRWLLLAIAPLVGLLVLYATFTIFKSPAPAAKAPTPPALPAPNLPADPNASPDPNSTDNPDPNQPNAPPPNQPTDPNESPPTPDTPPNTPNPNDPPDPNNTSPTPSESELETDSESVAETASPTATPQQDQQPSPDTPQPPAEPNTPPPLSDDTLARLQFRLPAVRYDAVPLGEVLEFIAKLADLPLKVTTTNPPPPDDLTIDRQTPVTADWTDISLTEMLDRLAAEHHLAYQATDDFLFIAPVFIAPVPNPTEPKTSDDAP